MTTRANDSAATADTPATSAERNIETIYIAPGENFCNIYALPYRLRYGQKPSDILYQHRSDWIEVGQLKSDLKLRYLAPGYQHLRDEIEGLMGGTFFVLADGQVEELTDAQRAAMAAEHYR